MAKKTSKIAQVEQMSEGSQLVSDLMAWLATFISMPDEYRIVVALYAIHSYHFRKFDSSGYLAITSSEPHSGKSTVLETVAALACNGRVFVDPTKATLFNIMGEYHNDVLIAWDECEVARSERDDRREIINSGYRASGSIPRVNRHWTPGSAEPRFIDQPTFAMYAFALIGSLAPTIKDRSILLTMRPGKAPRRYRNADMIREAAEFKMRIGHLVHKSGTFPAKPTTMLCEWLEGREAELWEPLFTTASYLGLTSAQSQLFRHAADLLTEMKHADTSGRYTMVRKIEDRTLIEQGAEPLGRRALADLASVIGADGKLWTATVVERMRKLDHWRAYRNGKGIDDQSLADLVAPFGVKAEQLKIAGKNRRGYTLSAIQAALLYVASK